MRNVLGSPYDPGSTSTGILQQRDIAPWNARERNNVAAAFSSFYEVLVRVDVGQPIGELAQDVQNSAYPERYALAIPEAREFYLRVQARLADSGPITALVTDGAECAPLGAGAGGEADLREAITLYRPRSFSALPTSITGGATEYVDTRIRANVVWAARTYHLRVTQGRGGIETGSPSVSHGYGTSVDLVPQPGYGWDQTTRNFALDLGWTPACGSSGERPACDLVPAILAVYYDDYPGHGTGDHLHVTWYGAMGPSDGHLHPPVPWVRVFPIAEPAEDGRDSGEVLVIGDSLTVGTRPYLKQRLGEDTTVDGVMSRSSSDGLAVLEERLDREHGVVAFDLGTNDASVGKVAENLRAARRTAGSRCLVVSTLNRPERAATFNAEIRDFAGSAPNVELFDWRKQTSERPRLLADDGVHATAEGYRRRAAGLIEAIERCR